LARPPPLVSPSISNIFCSSPALGCTRFIGTD